MFFIKADSEVAVIVIHEIYGLNKHMATFCNKIAQQQMDVFCPNLLNKNKPFDYRRENKAYSYFIGHVGFKDSVAKITDLNQSLRNQYRSVYVIGFSVGATIAWLCSENEQWDGVVGYYGSRIRDYMDIKPRCPVLLHFPEQEKSFHVDDLIRTLSQKESTQVLKYEGLHGFADPYSKNYCRASCERAFRQTLHFIKKSTF
ncbi:dienelactone hydrolase family protein [Desulforamulus ruminis]|uniref:Dienelactone hydrolase n=1 Tax=Desulforamulus ruminis (strain ATCC 23193 / DSM 2154 / NCIMB 8452 / DL) TaxID=696281 RepID=F6DSE3_DESRL|nr:dienelactone hydrolase family protein [Desulforamulus ruminis]AEG59922.1 dienelactone hydrolase [Desulforamulus ruminis DSM 2154]